MPPSPRPPTLSSPPRPDNWEELCHGCGGCCFEKDQLPSGKLVATPLACRYLDIVSRRCKVYPKRFLVEPTCLQLTPELVASVSWLPEDCGYVKWLRDRLNHL